MAEGSITTDELGRRLIQAGHLACEDGDTACVTDVWPTPETIVTVGMNLDPTLRPAYRQRDCACYLKSEEDPIPALRDDPSFALPAPFQAASLESPGDVRFLGGPCRWLLRRFDRFESVLLWPACPESDTSGAFAQAGLLDEIASLRGKLPAEAASLSRIGAVTLDLRRESDCRALWEVMYRVSQSFLDFFLADPECRQDLRPDGVCG